MATMASLYSVNTARNVPEWEGTLWVTRRDPLVRWPLPIRSLHTCAGCARACASNVRALLSSLGSAEIRNSAEIVIICNFGIATYTTQPHPHTWTSRPREARQDAPETRGRGAFSGTTADVAVVPKNLVETYMARLADRIATAPERARALRLFRNHRGPPVGVVRQCLA